MKRTFDLKEVRCDSSEIHDKIYELETEWLTALLLRSGISKIMIKKALEDAKYGAQEWRDYLFDTRNITIINNLESKQVQVFQVSSETGKQVKVGEWNRPTIIREKGGKFCQLDLKYWQII